MLSQSENLAVPLVFWQPILSPHQTPLLEQLRVDWPGQIHLIVDRETTPSREKNAGWQAKIPKGINFSVNGIDAPSAAIHVVSGFYGTKSWRDNFRRITQDKNSKIWIMAESLETWDHPIRAALRFLRHGVTRVRIGNKLNGFLAIGRKAEFQSRLFGVPKKKIHPFCYVTSPPNSILTTYRRREANNQPIILFLGAIIKRKGADVLFQTSLPQNARLQVIGAHIDQSINIPRNTEHLGIIANTDVSQYIRNADVLVLPSRHDGWGAVINEALMVGTPVVCTSACGGSTLLQSEFPFRGKVIEELSSANLSYAINEVLSKPVNHDQIINWSKESISPRTISLYLTKLLSGENSIAPWITN